MNPFRLFALAAKRHQLRKVDEFVRVLEDQVQYGEASLRYWRERQRRLGEQIDGLESPDSLIRRAGI